MSSDRNFHLKESKGLSDIAAEQVLLGCILQDNKVLDEIIDKISVDSFYDKRHKAIFSGVTSLYEEGKNIDEILLGHQLSKMELLEKAGGYYYFADLTSVVPLSPNIQEYVKIIRDYYQMRKILEITYEIAAKSTDASASIEDIWLELQDKLSSIYDLKTDNKTMAVSDVLGTVVKKLEERSENPDLLIGVGTGFLELDDLTLGFQNSDLIVLAARPSMGKTAFALNIASFVSLQSKKPVHFFSLEMPKEQLVMRILGSEAEISSENLKLGRLSSQEWKKFYKAVDKIAKAELYITDVSGLTISEIVATAKSLANKVHTKMIVVDYLQLIRSIGKQQMNREQEIAEISRSLKALAKSLDVPIIAISQLNRSPETRINKRPLMSDIRESGAIEQDADLVMFLYRDEIYNSNTLDKGLAELIISKHRNGPVGSHKLAFLGKYTKFANVSVAPTDYSYGEEQ